MIISKVNTSNQLSVQEFQPVKYSTSAKTRTIQNKSDSVSFGIGVKFSKRGRQYLEKLGFNIAEVVESVAKHSLNPEYRNARYKPIDVSVELPIFSEDGVKFIRPGAFGKYFLPINTKHMSGEELLRTSSEHLGEKIVKFYCSFNPPTDSPLY